MKQWNEEEIRAAMGPILNCSNNEERIIAELNKPTPPPIHPDVPVMYDFNGEPCTAFAHYDFHSGVTNIRPLMPTEAVMEKARERDAYLREFGSQEVQRALAAGVTNEAFWMVFVAHYIKTGET